MGAKETFDEILPALSAKSWLEVRAGVARLADVLQAATHKDAAIVAAIGDELLRLTKHAKWAVRKAVAEAVQHLHHETFNITVSQLIDDENTFVRGAARRTLARRTELTRTDTLQQQHGELLQQRLADHERRYGIPARRDAMRVAEEYAGIFIREARHEINRVIAPLELSFDRLSVTLNAPRVDRKTLHEVAEAARGRIALLSAIIESLDTYTTNVTSTFESESLRMMIAKAVSLVKDSRRTNIAVDVGIASSIRVEAHQQRLVQAFSNIIQNAFEAYEPGKRGRLRIEAVALGSERIAISFADTGCGMSDEAVRDAFRLFSTRKLGGTGFGLPLAKKIIENEHGGSIEIISTKDVGTTVTTILPIEHDEGAG